MSLYLDNLIQSLNVKVALKYPTITPPPAQKNLFWSFFKMSLREKKKCEMKDIKKM